MSWCQFSTNDRNGERVDEGGGTDEKMGMTADVIMNATGLSMDEIDRL